MIKWPSSGRKRRSDKVTDDVREEAMLENEAIDKLKKEKREAQVDKKMRELQGEEGSETDQEDSQDAKGKGKSPIYITNVIGNASSSKFWLFFIGVVAALAFGWYYDKLRIALIWVGVGLYFLFIAYGLAGIVRKDTTRFWVGLALLVWMMDMVPPDTWLIGPLLGAPYAGFEFPIDQLWIISWSSVLTSGLVFALLYVNMIFDIVKKEIMSFLLGFAFILITNNFIARFSSYFPNYLRLNFTFYVPHWANILILFFIIVLGIVAYVMDRKFRKEVPNFFTYLFMVFVFSFFYIYKGWMSNIRAVIHFIFIILFGFLYIKPKEFENPIAWHLLIPALLLIDFFGYGLLWNTDYPWVKFIPIFVIFVITYCYYQTENKYALVTFIFLITVILVLSLEATAYQAAGTLDFKPRAGGSDVTKFFSTLADKTKDLIQNQLELATGGYYRGNVEKNRYESLGVYFANVRAADPRFYVNEPITVWGTIRSKTYKDVVIVKFSCYRWENDRKILGDKIIPEKKLPFFTLDEVDTECTFLPSKGAKNVKPGSNIVTMSAEYNFGTDAYLKTYFIDRDRFRASAREDIDPLTQFGIKDKSPLPIFTNGPVEIGIKAGPLITVSKGYTVKPTIGISLFNRKEIQDKDKKVITRWDGTIKNIAELILLTPPGVTIDGLDKCNDKSLSDEERKLACPCNVPFVGYDADKCKNTCKESVLDSCTNACTDAYLKEVNPESCIKECEISSKNCELECIHLFNPQGDSTEEGAPKVPGEGYHGYALDVNSLTVKDINKDIDLHRTFECRFTPSEKVLEKTPITTKYFRVRARYNYLTENSFSVAVEKPPEGTLGYGADYLVRDDIGKVEGGMLKIEPDVEIPLYLLQALIYKESKEIHCCAESGKNHYFDCKKSEDKSCGDDRILKSFDGSSIGIMQINKNVNARLASKICKNGQTIYDRECNIRVGIELLRRGIIKYRNGIDENSLKKICSGTNTFDGVNLYDRYKSYEGFDAVLRSYIGWGCSIDRIADSCRKLGTSSQSKLNNCIRGTVFYVEQIREIANKIESGALTVPSIPEFEDYVITTEGSLQEFTESSFQGPDEQIQGPFPIGGSYNSNTGIIFLTWRPSKRDGVTGYKMMMSVANNPYADLCTINADGNSGQYSCSGHTNATVGVPYKYKLYVITKDNQFLDGTYSITP